jgi:hypothetical protein
LEDTPICVDWRSVQCAALIAPYETVPQWNISRPIWQGYWRCCQANNVSISSGHLAMTPLEFQAGPDNPGNPGNPAEEP